MTMKEPVKLLSLSIENDVYAVILNIINYINKIDDERNISTSITNFDIIKPFLYTIRINNEESYKTIIAIEDYLLYSEYYFDFYLLPGITIDFPIIFKADYSLIPTLENHSNSYFIGIELTQKKASEIKNDLEEKYPELILEIVRFENTFENYYNTYYAEKERRSFEEIEEVGP